MGIIATKSVTTNLRVCAADTAVIAETSVREATVAATIK